MPFFTKKIIEFSTLENFQDISHRPLPARSFVPDWFKFLAIENQEMPTLKKCPPFVDTFNTGYIIPAWQEFVLSPNDGVYNFFAGHTHLYTGVEQPRPVCSYQYPAQYHNTPLEGYQVIKLQTPWIIKTPPGVSLLLLPLLNDYSKDIEPIPAVIDSDTYHVNFGFTCKIKYQENKTIHINPGDPLVQIIPFERSRWKIKHSIASANEYARAANNFKTYLASGYKKLFWRKKEFN